jgi:hypothetical protein
MEEAVELKGQSTGSEVEFDLKEIGPNNTQQIGHITLFIKLSILSV